MAFWDAHYGLLAASDGQAGECDVAERHDDSVQAGGRAAAEHRVRLDVDVQAGARDAAALRACRHVCVQADERDAAAATASTYTFRLLLFSGPLRSPTLTSQTEFFRSLFDSPS